MYGVLWSILLGAGLAFQGADIGNTTELSLVNDSHHSRSLHKRTWFSEYRCNWRFGHGHALWVPGKHLYWTSTDSWKEHSAMCTKSGRMKIYCFKTSSVAAPITVGNINQIDFPCAKPSTCEEFDVLPLARPGDPRQLPLKSGFCVPKGVTYYLILRPGRSISQSCMKPAVVHLHKGFDPKGPPAVVLLRRTTFLLGEDDPTTTFEKHIEISTNSADGPYKMFSQVFGKTKTSVAYVSTASTIWVKFCVAFTQARRKAHPIIRMDASAIEAVDADNGSGIPLTLELTDRVSGDPDVAQTYDVSKLSEAEMNKIVKSATDAAKEES